MSRVPVSRGSVVLGRALGAAAALLTVGSLSWAQEAPSPLEPWIQRGRSPLPSLYDPHPVPRDRPWLEGYYTRISDPSWGGSLAVLAGSCSAPGGVPQPGYAALLVQRPGQTRIEVHEAFPQRCSVRLRGGRPVRRAPRLTGEPGFSWTSSAGTFGPRRVELRFASGWEVSASFGAPRSWTGKRFDYGPEGLLVRVPWFTQHWFVHSVASSARYTIRVPGKPPHVGEGWAHQEKNWGSDFPRTWVWAQGLSGEPGTKGFAQFALAGGEAQLRWGREPEQGLKRPGWLLGVRVQGRRVAFRSPGDRFRAESQPKTGRFVLEATGRLRRARITLQAAPESFAEVSVPTARGFRPGARESFRAEARLELWERAREGADWGQAATARIAGAALEFGDLPSGAAPAKPEREPRAPGRAR